MKTPIFPGKYHQNGGFSMAMLVYRRVAGDKKNPIQNYSQKQVPGPKAWFLQEARGKWLGQLTRDPETNSLFAPENGGALEVWRFLLEKPPFLGANC